MRSRIVILSLIIISAISCKKDAPDPFAGDLGVFTDKKDGNEYNWVRIGDQVWMAENLAYLPEVYTSTDGSEDVGKENDLFYYVYGYYGSDVDEAKSTDNYSTYGVLYNWKAAMSSCPAGWHLPSDEEWMELEQELGITDGLLDYNVWRGTDEGGMLKETGTSHWDTPNEGATDLFGFSALPGGYRGGPFDHLGQNSFFYTSSVHEDYPTAFISRGLRCDLSTIFRTFTNWNLGKSVRCIKD